MPRHPASGAESYKFSGAAPTQVIIGVPFAFPQLGAALGLLSILVMVAVQGAFLAVQLAQGVVFAVLMPMSPLALSWIVNHLYATPLGRVIIGSAYPRRQGLASLALGLTPLLAAQSYMPLIKLSQLFVVVVVV